MEKPSVKYIFCSNLRSFLFTAQLYLIYWSHSASNKNTLQKKEGENQTWEPASLPIKLQTDFVILFSFHVSLIYWIILKAPGLSITQISIPLMKSLYQYNWFFSLLNYPVSGSGGKGKHPENGIKGWHWMPIYFEIIFTLLEFDFLDWNNNCLITFPNIWTS